MRLFGFLKAAEQHRADGCLHRAQGCALRASPSTPQPPKAQQSSSSPFQGEPGTPSGWAASALAQSQCARAGNRADLGWGYRPCSPESSLKAGRAAALPSQALKREEQQAVIFPEQFWQVPWIPGNINNSSAIWNWPWAGQQRALPGSALFLLATQCQCRREQGGGTVPTRIQSKAESCSGPLAETTFTGG